MPRKEEFKELLKDVPEMTEEEKAYYTHIGKQQIGIEPKKTIKELTNEELEKLEQDVKDSEVYTELHKLQMGDNYEYAKTFLNGLKIKINIEKELRKLN